MYLKEFLHEFEEQRAFRRVEDHLKSDADGKARAEFLGQFLSSVFQPIFEKHNQSLVTIGFEAFIRPVVNDKNFSPRHYFERLAEEDKSFADLICRDLHLSNFIGAAQKNEFISINIVAMLSMDTPPHVCISNTLRNYKLHCETTSLQCIL